MDMKIYITEFEKDGKSYYGPYLYADSWESAEIAAEELGVILVGELDTVVAYNYLEGNKDRTIH